MRLPSSPQKILLSHNKVRNVFLHCQAVAKMAEKICKKLEKKSVKVNTKLVVAGAWLHDICRAKEHTADKRHLKEALDDHAESGYRLIKKLGYPNVAQLIRTHSLILENPARLPKTIEEKIVFYADKLCIGNKIATVKGRMEDLSRRYGRPFEKEQEYTLRLEKELFN